MTMTAVEQDRFPEAREAKQERFWHGLSLRSRLMYLGAATILPICLFAGAAFTVMLHQQQSQAEQSTLAMSRALAAALDARMQRSIAALEAFALAKSLQDMEDSRLAAVHASARLLRAASPDWRGVVLAKPDGSVVFGSESEFGQSFVKTVETASLSEVVRNRAPGIGPMVSGPRGNIGFTVRIPVMRAGEVRYVLTAIVSTDTVLDVIERQQVPEDWVVSIFDSNMRRVARSKDHERHFGTPPSPTLQTMLNELGDRSEGVGMTTTMEGEEAYTAVSKIEPAGWIVALGASSQIAHAPLWRTAGLYTAGLVISLLVGGSAFVLVSRTITTRARALRDSAVALGLGAPIPPPTQGLPDFDEVSSALWSAGQQRASVTGRLEMLLTATSSLTQSLDEAETLNAVARALVPGVADALHIKVFKEGGGIERQLTLHRDPSWATRFEELLQSGALSTMVPSDAASLVGADGERVHHFDAESVSRIEDPGLRDFVEITGMRALCAMPLVARDRVIGTMTAMQSRSGRRFEADDVALLNEFGRRAALALENVRLYAECNSALDEARKAGRAKDEFLAMLGHELRNPLAPILACVEILKRRDSGAFVREREIIERQAKHLALLVDDLLDVSRIVAGKIQLRDEEVDLRLVVLRAIEMTQPLFAQRPEPVLVSDAEPLPVKGDFLRLAQVVGNLLNNAAKFSEPDEPVVIELKRQADRVLLTVTDRGTGIAAALLPHVFDRFVQSEQTLQRSKSGLGLGLTIALSIVELHGGTIEAQPGGGGVGTAVRVSLPLLPVLTSRSEAPDAGHRHTRPIRILVVDDNRDAANTLAIFLTEIGHQVETVFDASTCLNRVAAFAPDACIVDIGLPDMDGHELARRLREITATGTLHLMALTGYGQSTDREKALRNGFDEHMAKPANLDMLVAWLDAIQRPGSAAPGE